MVCSLDFPGQRHLAVDASKSLGAGKAVSILEAGNLCFAIGCDHNNLIDAFVYAGFEEEWDFIDNDSDGFVFGDQAHESSLLAGDAGMDDAFELLAFFRIAENDAPKGMSIERTVRVQDCFPKCFDDGSPGRFTWLDDMSCQQVGIDHRCAAFLEHVRHGALASGNTACEAD